VIGLIICIISFINIFANFSKFKDIDNNYGERSEKYIKERKPAIIFGSLNSIILLITIIIFIYTYFIV
jgi:hypothetical protein